MSKVLSIVFCCALMLCTGFRLAAEAYAPMVTMTVQLPDGQTKELSAHESGLATVTVNGQEFGFRPTMMDDAGKNVVVTIFKLGTNEEELGEVETGQGKRPVESKTKPAFKVSISRVASTSAS
jgi:hypothetical protein